VIKSNIASFLRYGNLLVENR